MKKRLATSLFTAGLFLLPGLNASGQESACAGYETANLAPDATFESVAMDGDVLVAGWPRFGPGQQGSGKVYVYLYQAGSGWTEVQQLLPSGGAPGEKFGKSVAVDGDVIVVGEESDSCDEAAFVFRFNGSSWVDEQKLTPSAASLCNYFGSAVAVSGDTILVGAERDHHPLLGSDAGTVFAYRYDGAQWLEEAILYPATYQTDARFGNAIAMDGDLALIGAPGRDGLPTSGFDPGAVFAFHRGAGGVWTEGQKIIASNGVVGDDFGSAIAIDGSQMSVGAYRHRHNGAFVGAAYVYELNGSTWGNEQYLSNETSVHYGNFGRAVGLTGDYCIVGTPWQSTPYTNSGVLRVFEKDNGSWSASSELRASDAHHNGQLGQAIAAQEDRIVSGARGDIGAYAFSTPTLLACPTTYCVGKVSSNGCLPMVSSTGSASFTSDGPFLISATSLERHTWGIMAFGTASADIPFMGGSLCIAAPHTRLPPQYSGGISGGGQFCSGRLIVSMRDRIQSGNYPTLVVGSTVYAQFFYRDTADTFGMGLSNAIEFLIQP